MREVLHLRVVDDRDVDRAATVRPTALIVVIPAARQHRSPDREQNCDQGTAHRSSYRSPRQAKPNLPPWHSPMEGSHRAGVGPGEEPVTQVTVPRGPPATNNSLRSVDCRKRSPTAARIGSSTHRGAPRPLQTA